MGEVVAIDEDQHGAILVAGLELPNCPTARTGRGSHYLFKANGSGLANVVFAPGLQLKCKGGYIVAPPSQHASGHVYAWVAGHSLADVPLKPLPEEVGWMVAAAHAKGNGATRDNLHDIFGGLKLEQVFVEIEQLAPDSGDQWRQMMLRIIRSLVNRGWRDDAILLLCRRATRRDLGFTHAQTDAFVAEEIQRTRHKDKKPEPDEEDEFNQRDDQLRQHPTIESLTMNELLDLEFKDVTWVVPDVLCEGLTIFAGRPKLGKSWMALDFGLAVSAPGHALGSIACDAGDVLMLALEDSKRRLKSRLRKLCAKPNQRMTLAVSWPRLNDGCIEGIKDWLDRHHDARLVVIDTLVKIRPRGIATKDAYQADADALTELHRLANDRAIAILVVHHTRKAAADDWLDSVAGTTGITGSADLAIVLKRERGQADAFLFGTGRDLPDYEIPLKFDEQTCRWRKLEMSGPEARATSEQTAIINALRAACGAGLLRSQIAAMTGRSNTAISHALRRMEDAGLVEAKGNLWHLTV